MFFTVAFSCLSAMMTGVLHVAVCDMSVVSCLLVMTSGVMLCRFAMMFGGMLKLAGCPDHSRIAELWQRRAVVRSALQTSSIFRRIILDNYPAAGYL
jgi:hypothetical protein